MTIHRLHAPPARRVVARELFRIVGLSLRAELALVALAMAWATGVIIYASTIDAQYLRLDMVPEIALPFLGLAFVAPIAVWKNHGPSRRGYPLTMPVSKRWHKLTRNAVGLLWVTGGLMVYLLWMELMVLAVGGENSVEFVRVFIGDDWQNRTPQDFVLAVWAIPAWQWAVPFVAATAVYLIGAAPVLGVEHPWWWLLGIWFVGLLIAMVAEGALERSIEIVVLGKYGLATLLTGDTFQAVDMASLTTSAPTPFEQGTFDTVLHQQEGSSTVIHRMPDLRAWLLSTALWMGSGMVSVLAAVHLRKDDVV